MLKRELYLTSVNYTFSMMKRESAFVLPSCAISGQSRIYKVARLKLLRRNSSPGGPREDKDAKEEAVLKSEKLNYIAVKNDARGFSVS